MNKMRIRSLIAGMVASAAVALVGDVAIAQRIQEDSGAKDISAAAVSSKEARAELAARLAQTNMLKKGGTNVKSSADRAAKIVEELSDDRVMSALSKSSHAELEAVLFGSQAARDLLDSLVDKGTSVAGIQKALGSFSSDLVYTPLTPCRIMDTRIWSAGALTANLARGFDVRSAASIAAQGGVAAGGCGVLVNSRAIAVNITAISPASGWLYAWQWGAAIPNSSILNWAGASTGAIANSTVLTVDYSDNFAAYIQTPVGGTHVLMDVLGYFAPPVATALDCTIVQSATVSVPNNVWTNIDAVCPAGRTVTGGGYNTPEGTLGYPGVWITNLPVSTSTWRTWVDNQTGGNRNIFTTATCCRIPGR